jgi:phage shock protein A
MNAHPRPTATIQASVSSPADARKLADALMRNMDELLKLIEQETALVRAGKVREAMQLDTAKTDLSRRYVSAIAGLRANQRYMTQATPDLLAALHRHHDTFRAMLQVNLTVLATAHAVSEGIVRGVNGEMQRKAVPSTYTAAGQRNTAGTNRAAPLTLSRTL